MEPRIDEKAKKIKMMVMDVDGVLTDGSILFASGRQEIKAFFVHDGLGLRMAHRAGIVTALISARESEMVTRRAAELQIPEVHQRIEHKIPVWENLLKKYQLLPENVAMVGDDLSDLPLLQRAGLSVAVANAVEEVKGRVDYVTRLPGGRGAVREAVELVLRAQGRYEEELKRYLQ
jgi:3-deoxy-D-manno-octulosonate 8-phosphate phosphatase (KDO 8-P phosphatase)